MDEANSPHPHHALRSPCVRLQHGRPRPPRVGMVSRRSRRARNSLSFNFIRLATHLHLQRLIGGLTWGVPFNPHCIGDFHSCVGFASQAITGHEEEGRLLEATIHIILPPFRRHGEMLASDGEKVGRTNNVPRGKGTNREKATL
jgi:hypothetical protein